MQVRGIAINGVSRQPAVNNKVLEKSIKMMNKQRSLQSSDQEEQFYKKSPETCNVSGLKEQTSTDFSFGYICEVCAVLRQTYDVS